MSNITKIIDLSLVLHYSQGKGRTDLEWGWIGVTEKHYERQQGKTNKSGMHVNLEETKLVQRSKCVIDWNWYFGIDCKLRLLGRLYIL